MNFNNITNKQTNDGFLDHRSPEQNNTQGKYEDFDAFTNLQFLVTYFLFFVFYLFLSKGLTKLYDQYASYNRRRRERAVVRAPPRRSSLLEMYEVPPAPMFDIEPNPGPSPKQVHAVEQLRRIESCGRIDKVNCTCCESPTLFSLHDTESLFNEHMMTRDTYTNSILIYQEKVYVKLTARSGDTDIFCLSCYIDFWLVHSSGCRTCNILSPSSIYDQIKANSHLLDLGSDDGFLKLVAKASRRKYRAQMGIYDYIPFFSTWNKGEEKLIESFGGNDIVSAIQNLFLVLNEKYDETMLKGILVAICMTAYAYHGPSVQLGILVALSLTLIKRGIKQLRIDMDNLKNLVGEYVPQDGFDNIFLLVTLYFGITSQDGKIPTLRNIFNSLIKAGSSKKSLQEVFLQVSKCLEAIYNFVVSDYLGFPAVHFFEDVFPECTAWCERVSEERKRDLVDGTTVDIEKYNVIEDLLKIGTKIRAQCLLHNELKHLVSEIQDGMKFLYSIQERYASSGIFRDGTRFEPLGIVIRGDTDIGKSSMSKPFLAKLMARVIPNHLIDIYKKNPASFMYNAAPENKYWDGYAGQFATIFDDFGQARDAVGEPDNEYFKLIRCINDASYMLHMADVGSKGKVYFESKIVYATTNLSTFKPVSIVLPAAVTRRFHIDVTCHVADGYELKGKGDSRKLDKSKLDGSHKPEMHYFICNMTKRRFTFDELLDHASATYDVLQKRYNNRVLDLSKFVEDGLLMRPQMWWPSEPSNRIREIICEFKKRVDHIPKIKFVGAILGSALVYKLCESVFDYMWPKPQYSVQLDQTSLNMTKSIFRRNLVSFRINGNHLGYMLFLSGTDAIFPCHYIARLREVEGVNELEFLQNGAIFATITVREFVEKSVPFPKSEQAIFRFPLTIGNKRSILGCFVTEDTFGGRKKGRAILAKPMDIGDSRNMTVTEMDFKCLSNYNTDIFGSNQSFKRMLEYSGYTTAGDCGLPLFICDNTTRGEKIVGFHVAGSSCGSSLAVCVDVPGVYKEYLKMRPELCVNSLKTMRKIGEVPTIVGHQVATSIRPSPLYNVVWETKKKPAALTKGQTKNGTIPFETAVLKYDAEPAVFDEELIEPCLEAVFSILINGSSPEQLRILSFEEAIKGDPNDEFLGPMPRNTSAGYPYNVEKVIGYPGKTRFFGKEAEYDLTRDECIELERKTNAQLLELKEGRGNFLYTDNLKDELRTIEKVAEGKSRLFAASNIEYSILMTRYFKHFSAWLMRNRFGTGMSPGLNPYKEWGVLSESLLTISNNIVAGDFSGFDTKQSGEVLRRICKHIHQIYDDGDENARIRENLWKEIYNSRHVVGRDILEWSHSNPSGQPLTTTVNCIYNLFLHCYAWVKAHEGKISSLNSFGKHVKGHFFGDDSILAVSDEKIKIYNQNTLREIWGVCGIEYTDELKSSAVAPDSRSLEEVSYLKRKFRFEPILGRYVGPLSLETIHEMVSWSKKGPEYHNICRGNVDVAVHELSLHGKEVFEKETKTLLKEARERLGYQPTFTSWELVFFETCQFDKFW